MLFEDEEKRLTYHQSNSLLQVVCGIFESCLANHGIQCKIIECGLTEAAIEATECTKDVAKQSCAEINKQFMRKDGMATCYTIEDNWEYFYFFVTTAQDFAQLN